MIRITSWVITQSTPNVSGVARLDGFLNRSRELFKCGRSGLGIVLWSFVIASRLAADDGFRPGDELWRLSTRSVAWDSDFDFPQTQLGVSVWDAQERQWRDSTWADFVKSQTKTTLSVIYVHGNRVEPGEDTSHGLAWYQSIIRHQPSLPAMQFVVWTWPSSKIRGQIRDVRSKYQRAHVEVRYLGGFLKTIPSSRPTMLVGFSFGGLIIPGALDQVAQSSKADASVAASRPWSAVLAAAAVHHDWLLPGNSHGRSLSAVRQMRVFVNGNDCVLKRYRLVDRNSRPMALGRVGMPLDSLPKELVARVTEHDVSSIAGRGHREVNYRNSSMVMGWISDSLKVILPEK